MGWFVTISEEAGMAGQGLQLLEKPQGLCSERHYWDIYLLTGGECALNLPDTQNRFITALQM